MINKDELVGVKARIDTFFCEGSMFKLAKNEPLLSAGENPAGIYFLKTGVIKQFDISDSGVQLIVNEFKPGAHFPMSWAVNQEANIWFFEAKEDSTFYVRSVEDVLALMTLDPEVMMAFVKRISSGASGQQRRMVHLMGGSAATRVLFELIIEFKRFGVREKKGVHISIAEAELANKTGLTRETVSKEIKKLKEAGIVNGSYRKVCAQNIDVLEEYLGLQV